MGTIADPFSGLIQGVLQGHAIAEHLRQQSMQEEAFHRNMQRDADEQQIHFLTLQQQLENTGAKRVIPGSNAVPESFEAPSPGAAPGMTDTTQTITHMRPVDKSRLITARDPNSGQQVQWETPTLQDRIDRELALKRQEALVTAQGGAEADVLKRRYEQQYLEAERERRGIVAPDPYVQTGYAQAGQKYLPEELNAMRPGVVQALSPEYKEVAPGATLGAIPRPNPFGTNAPMVGTVSGQQQQPDTSQTGLPAPVMPSIETPGRPQVMWGGPSFLPGNAGAPQAPNAIAAAGAPGQQRRADFVANAKAQGPQTPAPAQGPQAPTGTGFQPLFSSPPKPSGDFQMVYLPQYAKSLGKTVDQLTRADITAARTEWAKSNKNPVELQMEQARLALEQGRLAVERRNAGLDANGQPMQYADANGNPINISPIARGIASYKMAPLTARAYASNRGLMDQVLAVNPNWDIGQYEQRYNTFKDLGPAGKLGGQALALNTLVRHSDDLIEAIKGLGNGPFTPLNAGYQKLVQLFGGSAPTNFDQLKQYVAGETVKLVRGGGGNKTDEENAAANINRANSPSQLMGAMQTNFGVAGGKMQALNQAVRSSINDPKFTALDPGAAQILTNLGYDLETMKPRAAGAGSLPKGGGKPANAAILQQFLDANGGNKDAARKALGDYGWTIPGAQ
jgi:hypothetical protein